MREDITKDVFIEQLLDGMPPPPQYFQKNAILNKTGYKSFDKVITDSNKSIELDEFYKLSLKQAYLILDVRHQKDFIEGHIPNSLFIGLNGTFAPWVGTLIEDINQKIILITPEGMELETITRLSRVGYDNCIGYLKGGFNSWQKHYKSSTLKSISSQLFVDTLKLNTIKVLDVRRVAEFENKHIEGVASLPLSNLRGKINSLNSEDTYYIHCAGGYRSVIAASIFKAKGLHNVIDVAGGFGAIQKTDLNENCYNLQESCSS